MAENSLWDKILGLFRSAGPYIPTASVIRTPAGKVLQPVEGTVIPLEEFPDPVIAEGVLGNGVGIRPSGGVVVAPCDCVITTAPDTGHAIGLDANGMEILIHIGVDTYNMKGEGFRVLVHVGDKVKLGTPLVKFDSSRIQSAGYNDTVAVLLTNTGDYDEGSVECGLKKGSSSDV
ncbi:MAG: PTS glucose transporter subunit IIA [Oscillospiraceae bacterium]|nr:PTS glucose transporter subunit IIA [Oscillospiraceae bacterium]